MDYNALTALTGLGAALIAIYALWTESRRHRFSTSLDIMLRLEEQFTTKRMYANRQRAARAFESGKIDEAVNEIDEIINFFEGLGYLVERRAIDKKEVWTCFFYYMYRFFHFAGDYIDKERNRNPTLWTTLIDLYKTLSDVECRERKKQLRRARKNKVSCSQLTPNFNVEDLQDFLREETMLDLSSD